MPKRKHQETPSEEWLADPQTAQIISKIDFKISQFPLEELPAGKWETDEKGNHSLVCDSGSIYHFEIDGSSSYKPHHHKSKSKQAAEDDDNETEVLDEEEESEAADESDMYEEEEEEEEVEASTSRPSKRARVHGGDEFAMFRMSEADWAQRDSEDQMMDDGLTMEEELDRFLKDDSDDDEIDSDENDDERLERKLMKFEKQNAAELEADHRMMLQDIADDLGL
ncbi:hypothetical protein LZ554_006002 [Drepanopeziza brunnea f. sp. 'monogermtubi']|nr:hypothetical protein LZ554_006002 [Drepanopeziza brunnea f. sp. 'monogermtubi']